MADRQTPPAATGHKLVLEIAVPEFYVDGTEQEFADEHDLDLLDIALEEWMRPDVGLTFVTQPGEKNLNSDFEVKALEGRIVGVRIVKEPS